MTTAKTLYWPVKIVRAGYPGLTVLGNPSADAPSATGDSEALGFDGIHDGLVITENLLSHRTSFEIVAEFFPASGGRKEQRFFHIQADSSEDRILMETRLTADGQWYADSCVVSGDDVAILVDPTQLHPLNRWYRYTLSYDGTVLFHRIDDVTECSRKLPGLRTPLGGMTAIGLRATGDHFFCGRIRRISLSGAR